MSNINQKEDVGTGSSSSSRMSKFAACNRWKTQPMRPLHIDVGKAPKLFLSWSGWLHWCTSHLTFYLPSCPLSLSLTFSIFHSWAARGRGTRREVAHYWKSVTLLLIMLAINFTSPFSKLCQSHGPSWNTRQVLSNSSCLLSHTHSLCTFTLHPQVPQWRVGG